MCYNQGEPKFLMGLELLVFARNNSRRKQIVSTVQETMAENLKRLYMAALYGEVLRRPAKDVSMSVVKYYDKERYPQWIAKSLAELEPITAMNLVIEIAARIDEEFSRQTGEIFGYYRQYRRMLELAIAANAENPNDRPTYRQLAYWILAAVPADKRGEFARLMMEHGDKKLWKEAAKRLQRNEKRGA